MNLLKLKVLIVIAGILLSTMSGFAKAAFEIDGMPIDISQNEFLKKRPAAKPLSIRPNEYQTYLYFPNNYSWSGFAGTVLGRIFVKGNGCAASVGFEKLVSIKRKDLIRAIQLRHPKKTGEEKFVMTNGMLLYFEDNEVYVSVFLEDKSDIEPSSLAYTVSLKSCGSDLARKIQVLSRQ